MSRTSCEYSIRNFSINIQINFAIETSIFHVSVYYPKNTSAVKIGEDKKVQVIEQPKDVISPWGQKEKLYQLGCIYRTPAYELSQLI